MIRVVGMFGRDAAAVKLHASLRNNRIHLERHNFQHPEDMLRCITEEPDITAVLLIERALKEFNPEFTTVLEAIRTDEPTIRIIFIADTPERDTEFEQWCVDQRIYDIVYRVSHHERDENGVVVKTHGQHVRVGAISERLSEHLSLCGVDMGPLLQLMRAPDKN